MLDHLDTSGTALEDRAAWLGDEEFVACRNMRATGEVDPLEDQSRVGRGRMERHPHIRTAEEAKPLDQYGASEGPLSSC